MHAICCSNGIGKAIFVLKIFLRQLHHHHHHHQFMVKPKNRPGPARPGHVKIALDITAVDIDLFFLYCTGAMIIYDRFSL